MARHSAYLCDAAARKRRVELRQRHHVVLAVAPEVKHRYHQRVAAWQSQREPPDIPPRVEPDAVRRDNAACADGGGRRNAARVAVRHKHAEQRCRGERARELEDLRERVWERAVVGLHRCTRARGRQGDQEAPV
eukprot:365965-Chlamydomonas_euryale.AAC.13